jgi:hypothetical protein
MMEASHNIQPIHNIASDSPACKPRQRNNSTERIQTFVFSSNPMLAKPKHERMLSFENMTDLSHKLHVLMRTNESFQQAEHNHQESPRKSRSSLGSTYETMDKTTKRVVKHCIIDLDEAFDQWPPLVPIGDRWSCSCSSSTTSSLSSCSSFSSSQEEEDTLFFNYYNDDYYTPEVSSVFSDIDSGEEDAAPQQGPVTHTNSLIECRQSLVISL